MCLEPVSATIVAEGVGAGLAGGLGGGAFAGIGAYGSGFLGLPVLTTSQIIGASIASNVLSTGIGVYGQMQAGKNAKAMADYRAAVARNNGIVADRAAQDALARGSVAEQRSRLETARLKGRQRTVLAGLGQQVDTGSALDITSDTAQLGELDALTIRSNAEREAYNLRVRGMQFGQEAVLEEATGANALSAGYFGAAGTLASGVGTVADRWYRYRNPTLLDRTASP